MGVVTRGREGIWWSCAECVETQSQTTHHGKEIGVGCARGGFMWTARLNVPDQFRADVTQPFAHNVNLSTSAQAPRPVVS